MMTIKKFKESAGERVAALIYPVKNQLGCGSVKEFYDELENVNKSYCGAAAGFSGFIYCSDTIAFWRKNKKKILSLLEEQAFCLGEDILSMVLHFGCFRNTKEYTKSDVAKALYGNYNGEYVFIYNAFAFYALEEVAYSYENVKESC